MSDLVGSVTDVICVPQPRTDWEMCHNRAPGTHTTWRVIEADTPQHCRLAKMSAWEEPHG
jgi:hypothetical protein